MSRSRMLRTALLRLALLLPVAPLPSGASAQGAQDFTLVNRTGVDIYYLHVSPHSSDEWGEDILGVDILADGEEVEIVFDRSEREALWDLRIMDEDENEIVWENLNLLKILSITLFYDAETGRAWAETEEVDDDAPAVEGVLRLALRR